VPGQELYLVRHGESVSNVEERLCAVPPGPGLTDLGRHQAEVAATTLLAAARPHVQVVSSPLLRAWQTADALARKLGRAPTIETELRETAFGAWEGRTASDLRRHGAYLAWAKDPEHQAPRGVERPSRAGARALAALTALAGGMTDGTLVAFSHQHVLLGFVRLCGVLAQESWFPNAAVVHAVWQGGGWQVVSVDRSASGAGTIYPEVSAAEA